MVASNMGMKQVIVNALVFLAHVAHAADALSLEPDPAAVGSAGDVAKGAESRAERAECWCPYGWTFFESATAEDITACLAAGADPNGTVYGHYEYSTIIGPVLGATAFNHNPAPTLALIAATPEAAALVAPSSSFVWSPDIWSAGIAVLAMIVSSCFATVAIMSTRRGIALQRFQARQEMRNRAAAWADQVVEILQDGITKCFLYKQDPNEGHPKRHFTLLAGKTSELIDRGRWHFENDRESGFGMWKEGGYQGLAPKTISILKRAHGDLVGAAIKPPERDCCWDHLRDTLTKAKRAFVSEVQDFVQPSQSWGEVSNQGVSHK